MPIVQSLLAKHTRSEAVDVHIVPAGERTEGTTYAIPARTSMSGLKAEARSYPFGHLAGWVSPLQGSFALSVDVYVHAAIPPRNNRRDRGFFPRSPSQDHPEIKKRLAGRSLFYLSINCFILSTTPDKSLATSSFLKRITISPNSDNAFSLLASSSCCKS